MHPILFKLGPLEIHTYGFMAAVAFVVALQVIKRQSINANLPVAAMMDLAFYMIVAGIIGTRIFYVLQNWSSYQGHLIDAVKIWQGGLVWYGGLIICIPTLVLYVRKHQLPLWQVLDIFAPAVALGHAFGRLGCFAAGCCFGKPAPEGAWYAVVFKPVADTLAPIGIALYPTQLMESSAELAIFLILIFFVKRHKAFDGQVFLSYLILYAIARSLIEVLRGDIERKFVLENWLGQALSTSQFISIIFIGCAGIFLAVIYKNRKLSR